MKTHSAIRSGLATLLIGASGISLAFAQAQAPANAPAAERAAAGQPDASGNLVTPGAAPAAALPPPTPATACLQLHNGGVVANFNVQFDPNTTNFPITGGTISGGLCQASTWHINPGGHLGPNLAITATRPAGNNCSTNLTVAGNFANPSSYTGTYGFPGTGFQQHTLFLGYQKSSCP
jgi:hypothetical protein